MERNDYNMKNIINAFSKINDRKAHRIKKKSVSVLYSIFRLVILMSIGFIIIYPLMYTIVTSLQSKYAFMNSKFVIHSFVRKIKQQYKIRDKSFMKTLIFSYCSCLFNT